MKKRLLSLAIVFALTITMAGTNAFVVNTKAVSNEKKISQIVDGLKDSVDDYHKTHIKNDDGSKTVIDNDYKPVSKKKSRNALPSSYIAPYTSVKNQGSFGSCWMFGEAGSLESNLMNKAGYDGGLASTDPIDISEAQGVYVQLHKMTVDGSINGAASSDSDNDVAILHDEDYYGYDEGGWVFDASMSLSANKGSALESDNEYKSTARSARASESKTMAEKAASQYRLHRFDIKSANQLPEVFAVTGDEGSEQREYDASVRDIWKAKIIENGAISSNYSSSTDSEYNHAWGNENEYKIGPNFWRYDANAKNKYSTNHVITIVGFDDNYSKYNFIAKYTGQDFDSLVARKVFIKTTNNKPSMIFDEDGHLVDIDVSDTAQTGYQAYIVPKEDGAWHIKNSYGTENSGKKMYDDGIMHMSYCEETLSETVCSVVEEDLNQIQNGEKAYDTTLSHSSLMGQIGRGFNSGSKAAELYTIDSEKDIELDQIGYWTGDYNTATRVKLYSDLTDNSDPESGTLIYDSGDVTDSYFGYHTIKLNDAVTLARGTKVSAVISQECDSDCALMIEMDYVNTYEAYYTFNSRRGDTLYYDGNHWVDSKDFDAQARTEGFTVGNSTLKLFGNTITKKYTVSVDGVETEVEEGQTFTFPTTSENGYTNADYSTLYANGQTITPESDITVTSIQNIDFNMEKGASIDLAGEDAIRFLAQVDYSDEAFLNSENIELGTMIAPADLISDVFDGELDLESQAEHPSSAVKVVNSGWHEGNVGSFAASITNIREFNWDRKFAAKAYMTIKYSDGSTKSLYTGYSDNRSIVEVAETLRDEGYPGLTEEQIASIQKFLD